MNAKNKTPNTNTALFDPKTDGHSVWFLLHRMSVLATTDEKKKNFIAFMDFLSENYPCEKCRTHIKEFIKNNPFELYMYVTNGTKDVGMFKFGWILHNAVNVRLGKPTIDFDTAYGMYSPEEIKVCTADCDETKEEPVKPVQKSIKLIPTRSRN